MRKILIYLSVILLVFCMPALSSATQIAFEDLDPLSHSYPIDPSYEGFDWHNDGIWTQIINGNGGTGKYLPGTERSIIMHPPAVNSKSVSYGSTDNRFWLDNFSYTRSDPDASVLFLLGPNLLGLG